MKLRARLIEIVLCLGGIVASVAAVGAADEASGSPIDALIEKGRALWEQHAPADLQEDYAFPDAEQLDQFLAGLQVVLQEGSFEQLAAYEPEARRVVHWLRTTEEGEAVAAWLEPRLDVLTASAEWAALDRAEPPRPVARARPQRPGETTPPPVIAPVRPAARPQQGRAYWEATFARRKAPAAAAELVPRLKKVFRDAGVPAEWVWIAEVESSMNPKARSPVGARGLFQFMPATAERFGLRTSFPDERTHPERSAKAAAEYLTFLHRRFGSWPLALAAYNAGEGRVGRLLGTDGGGFDAIAHRLPAETRLYVPKVLATVAVREGVDPEALPGPRATFGSR